MADSALVLSVPLPSATPTPSTTSTAPSHSTAVPAVPPLDLAENDVYEVHFPPDRTFFVNNTILQFDAPNLFSTTFLSGFREQSSRRIVIADRSPDLFPYILDYLRGYAVFPLCAEAVPPHMRPLSKMYDNIRRDAAYYSLVRLESEARRWMRHELFPRDGQAVLKLDFTPYHGTNIADLELEVNIADATLLRKRYFDDKFQPAGSFLHYGPFPWKHTIDTLREAHQTDLLNIVQHDGSALIDAPPVFLKPPRTARLETSHRRYDCAKIYIPAQLTSHLLDHTTKPGSLTTSPTLRIHATNVTLKFRFTTPPRLSFLFAEREGVEGLAALWRLTVHQLQKDKAEMPREFQVDVKRGFALDVDDGTIRWADLVQWAHRAQVRRSDVPVEERPSAAEKRCDHTFSAEFDPKTNATLVSRENDFC